VDYLRLSMAAVNGSFHEFAHEAAVRSSPPDGGVFPATPFYADEIGRWADAAGG
jgi:hypothetical protein